MLFPARFFILFPAYAISVKGRGASSLHQHIEGDLGAQGAVRQPYLQGIGHVLQPLGRVLSDAEPDGLHLAAVALALIENNDIALFRLANVHDAEVEAVGGEPDIVVHADRKLPDERLLTGDALAFEGHGDALRLTAIDHGAALVELTALALRVERQGDSRRVARGNGLGAVEPDGGAVARGVTLRQRHRLRSVVAQPEGTLLHAISLLDGSELQGGHSDDDQCISEQHIYVRSE